MDGCVFSTHVALLVISLVSLCLSLSLANAPIYLCLAYSFLQVELSDKSLSIGHVTSVKVLGCFALIDEGETDWKILALATNHELASKINNLVDLEKYMPGKAKAVHEWFKNYKVPDGKPINSFAFGTLFLSSFCLRSAYQCQRHAPVQVLSCTHFFILWCLHSCADGKALDKVFAEKVIAETHHSWKKLIGNFGNLEHVKTAALWHPFKAKK